MVEQFRFSPEDEETIAGLVDSTRYLTKEVSPLPMAVALALLGEGYKRLREASSYNKGEGSVLTAPDPNYFFNSLTPALKQRAIDGLGFVLVGSLAWTVESAKSGGWDDNVYMSAFNEHIRGVPLPTISADIKKRPGFSLSTADDDTSRIQAINTNDTADTAETIELLSNDRWRLPTIVQVHLSKFGYEIQTTVFRKATMIFVETRKRLAREPVDHPSEPQTAEITPERRSSFLENMDHLIAGGKSMEQEIDEFLDEISKRVE